MKTTFTKRPGPISPLLGLPKCSLAVHASQQVTQQTMAPSANLRKLFSPCCPLVPHREDPEPRVSASLFHLHLLLGRL